MYRHCVTDPPPALISPLVTATMEHAHGHGSAPDHHERRFITMDHGGGGGPVPVAASPNKPQHRFPISDLNKQPDNTNTRQ